MSESDITERPWVRIQATYARNVAYNMLGQLVPLLVGVLVMPFLLRALGVERVGVLAIAWLVVGYSGLFDLGLSRSITQITAERLGIGDADLVPGIFWTAIIFAGILSVVATVLAWGLTGVVVNVLNITPALHEEVLSALRLFALSITPAILTSIMLGFFAAYGRFGLMNAIKIPTGVLMTASPLFSIAFGRNLMPVIVALVGVRWLTLVMFAWAATRVEPGILIKPRFHVHLLRPLLGMGSWITISNVVSPFLIYCDRFLIGSLLSVTAVAYYTTPQDAITKLLVLPAAIVSVLFPFIAGGYSTNRTDCIARAQAIFTQTFALMFPVIALVVVFARNGMTLWLGADFAGRSYQLLQLFAIGVLVNALAQVPATILQAIGKPRWAAILHVIELLLYVPASYFAVTRFGLIGAALVWGGRITFDAAALVWAVERAWSVKPLFRARDLLLKLVFAGMLATYVAFGNNRFQLGFLLIILALFSIIYRANIFALLRGAIAHYGLARPEADPSP